MSIAAHDKESRPYRISSESSLSVQTASKPVTLAGTERQLTPGARCTKDAVFNTSTHENIQGKDSKQMAFEEAKTLYLLDKGC